MVSIRVYLTVLCVASYATVGRALPYREVTLDKLTGNSICKTVVYNNTVDGRVPRVIKELKCAPEPDAMCPRKAGGQISCCKQNTFADKVFSCAEVNDWVLVKPPGADDLEPIEVSVGCVCAHQHAIEAQEVL